MGPVTYFFLLNVCIDVFYMIEQYNAKQKLPTSGLFSKYATHIYINIFYIFIIYHKPANFQIPHVYCHAIPDIKVTGKYIIPFYFN